MDKIVKGSSVINVVDKAWGFEEIWAKTDRYVGKMLHIKAGHRLSLQYHEVKDETILVLRGRIILHHNGTEQILEEGETAHIKAGNQHRFCAIDENVVLLEVSTPELDDVIRIEDDYNRATK